MAYVRNNMEQYNMHYMQMGLVEALALIEKAVKGEREDELFYDYLIRIAPTNEEKEIIKSIRDDEIKHNKMFRKIYKDFTGKDITGEEVNEFEKPKSYIDGIKKALMGELRAVETYRKIRQGIPYTQYKEMLFEIITDELKHGIKYNYILNINSMQKKERIKVKEKLSTSADKIGSSIGERSNQAIGKAKEKFVQERVLEEVLIPGIIQAVKNVYFKEENCDKMRGKIDIKQDVLVRYVEAFTENILGKVKEKVDLEALFERYIVPELLNNKQ